MNTYERLKLVYDHKEPDRIPIIDTPWAGTIRRWKREGMPDDVDWRDYFGVDKIETIHVDSSPQFETKVLEETPRYKIYTTEWGATLKNFKEEDSTPEFIDFKIKDAEKWKYAKERMQPTDDRIPWNRLINMFPLWRSQGCWIQAQFWFGFDITHSWTVGTETLLIAMATEPEWVTEMFETELTMCMKLFDKVWDAGYRFDSIYWPDDMGYKNNQFFSLQMYRELLKPFHKRAIDWAHNKGIKAYLHSCGNINPFIPELVEIGLDALNPLEVKAGMKPDEIKKDYGDKLVLYGGINAVLWDKPDMIKEEMSRLIPIMKQNSGYIFGSDHSIPNSVSLEDFRQIVAYAKKLGAY